MDQNVYVTNYNNNTVSVINTATNTVSANVNVGLWPYGVAVTPDGTKAYVTNFDSNTISVINITTNTVTATVNVGINPCCVFIGGPIIPVADFLESPTGGNAPLTATFTDGDSTTSEILVNPVHTYEKPGIYNVSLKAKNSCGSNTVTKSNYIVVNVVPPYAHFRISPTTGPVQLTVQFTDKTTEEPTSCLLNFGDGTTSTLQNPEHTYNTAGIYTATPTASNVVDTSTKISTVTISVT